MHVQGYTQFNTPVRHAPNWGQVTIHWTHNTEIFTTLLTAHKRYARTPKKYIHASFVYALMVAVTKPDVGRPSSSLAMGFLSLYCATLWPLFREIE